MDQLLKKIYDIYFQTNPIIPNVISVKEYELVKNRLVEAEESIRTLLASALNDDKKALQKTNEYFSLHNELDEMSKEHDFIHGLSLGIILGITCHEFNNHKTIQELQRILKLDI